MPPKTPPRFRIPVHLFTLSIASAPAIAYALYWKRNHSTDEEFEEKLQKHYSSEIQGSKDKKKDMVKFFQAMKNPDANPEHDKKLQEVLRGGKGDQKRHFAVDDKLYGTEEGVQKRKEAEEQLELEKKKAANRKKKGKKRKKAGDQKDEKQSKNSAKEEYISTMLPNAKQTTATVVGVGTLALLATLLSGRKSS